MTDVTVISAQPGSLLTQARARELFKKQQQRIYERTDKLFAFLLIAQWFAAIICTIYISPYAWEGTSYHIHSHVIAALFLGAMISGLPVYLAHTQPGALITRHVIAISQMLYSALLIHLTGGRIETHFHIFGSLALLAFYRDWRVLITASIVVAFDHFMRGIYWPQSVYGVAYASLWRTMEHVGWVVFEDIFLLKGISQSVNEMKDIAAQRADLEAVNIIIEQKVEEKTQELYESEKETRRFAEVLRQCDDAIMAVTPDMTVITWNQGAERMYGYKAEEIVGKSAALITAPRHMEMAKAIINRVVHGETVENLEGKAVLKGGKEIPISSTISPIRNNDGVIDSLSLVIRDISQKKLVEQRIKEFYSTVSHELRTPLTSIRGALALLADGVVEPGSEEAVELVQLARSSSIRLVRLINDILDLRKIEEGKLDFNIDSYSTEELVENAVNAMQGLADERSVIIKAESIEYVQLEADSDRITQVLSNLISNAIKYSQPQGEVEVTVKQKDRMVRFNVFDQGPGIPVELQHKLFGKFQQIDSSDSRAKEGSGLGLSISKAIVEQLGGRIGFESKPGQRTHFWFELPSLAKENVEPTKQSAEINDKPKVLVVEDDRELSSVVKISLEHQGYHCYLAANLEEARSVLSTTEVDVVVLDVGLPDGSGLKLIDELRSSGNSLLNDLPVVVITGGDSIQKYLYRAAICDWVAKPFDQDILERSIRRALISKASRQRILVVDDDSSTRIALRGHLSHLGFDYLDSDFKNIQKKIPNDWEPDVILMGAETHGRTEQVALEHLRTKKLSATPIVFYSSTDLSVPERNHIFCGVTKCLNKAQSEDEFLSAIENLLAELLPPHE
jgi:two-component system, sensor histidine kinase and response regulator